MEVINLSWRTPYTGQVRHLCPSGSRFKPEFSLHFADDGKQELREVGVIDTYADIQSHRMSVDIHHLIDVYSRTGDASVFERVSPAYGDVSDIPTNYADLLNLRYKLEREFAGLSSAIRGEFDNDVNKYVAQYGTEHWYHCLGFGTNSDVPDADRLVKEEVIDNVES